MVRCSERAIDHMWAVARRPIICAPHRNTFHRGHVVPCTPIWPHGAMHTGWRRNCISWCRCGCSAVRARGCLRADATHSGTCFRWLVPIRAWRLHRTSVMRIMFWLGVFPTCDRIRRPTFVNVLVDVVLCSLLHRTYPTRCGASRSWLGARPPGTTRHMDVRWVRALQHRMVILLGLTDGQHGQSALAQGLEQQQTTQVRLHLLRVVERRGNLDYVTGLMPDRHYSSHPPNTQQRFQVDDGRRVDVERQRVLSQAARGAPQA